MKITIYNFKGGVGKSSISLNLALSLDYGVITNDIYSPLEKTLTKEHLLKIKQTENIPDIPQDYNIIYDLGGYIDKRAIKALQNSDIVIVPTINDYLNLQVTIDTIQEIEAHNKNIILIANKTERGDFEKVKSIINEFYSYPILELKKSKSFQNILIENKSISQMCQDVGIKAYSYKTINKQFNKLIDTINNYA